MNQNLVLKIHSPLYTANLFDTRTNTANQLGTPALVVILLVSFAILGQEDGSLPTLKVDKENWVALGVCMAF